MTSPQSLDKIQEMSNRLEASQAAQDDYDNSTICLIAPASPTKPEYCDNLTMKHNPIAEGLLGSRPYAGAEHLNEIESIAAEAARSLFGAEHANTQPHSVSDANAAAYFATLEPGDPVLAMSFDSGGHLTHGMPKNSSGRLYDFSFYGVNEEGFIDYEAAAELAERVQPKLIVTGASSYPRDINFEKFANIARGVGAKLMGDLSHPAGLIAAGRFPQPFPHCDIVTLTPDKTMMGDHGGIILCKEELAKDIDAAVHPGIQSSVPFRRIVALARCLLDAHKPEFKSYIDEMLANMDIFAATIAARSSRDALVTGGSNTNLMVIKTLDTFGLTGVAAEKYLEEASILTNRQVVPNDMQKPYVASGVRLGASWITARGYETEEVHAIADAVVNVLSEPSPELIANTKEAMTAIAKTPHAGDVWHD